MEGGTKKSCLKESRNRGGQSIGFKNAVHM